MIWTFLTFFTSRFQASLKNVAKQKKMAEAFRLNFYLQVETEKLICSFSSHK